MNEENMVLKVLNEVLGELQMANKSLKEMGGTVKTLETRVQAFEQKEIKIEPPDLGPVSQAISGQCEELRKETAAGLMHVAAAVEKQPKPIIRRFSFFPENDREGNYKTFIRNVVWGILGTFTLVISYALINTWVLHMHPETAVESTSMKLPAGDTATVPRPGLGPVKRPVTAILHARPKKSEKKVDTLKYNTISHLLDSVGGLLESKH